MDKNDETQRTEANVRPPDIAISTAVGGAVGAAFGGTIISVADELKDVRCSKPVRLGIIGGFTVMGAIIMLNHARQRSTYLGRNNQERQNSILPPSPPGLIQK